MKPALDVLQRALDVGAMPGAAVCILRGGEIIVHEALGTRDGATDTTTDTLYDLASLTKPLATASSALTLVERGELTLAASVADLLGREANRLRPVTLQHLLTHTSGLPAWIACYENGTGLDAAVEAILRAPAATPGTKYEYSCLGYILLAKIVETAAGTTLDSFARAHVFAPLGLDDLAFRPDPSRPIAPTISREGPAGTETLCGVVHDGNARGIERGGRSVSGNAGLFGTACDVARFGEAVRAGGLFGLPTRRRMLTNQAAPAGHTLCFFCSPNGLTPAGDLLSDAAVGHSGFTGTVLTIDPAFDLTVALLTNAVFGEGKEDFLRYRRRFLNAVAGSIHGQA